MREWRLPAALILLGLIPMLAGAARLHRAGTGPTSPPARALRRRSAAGGAAHRRRGAFTRSWARSSSYPVCAAAAGTAVPAGAGPLWADGRASPACGWPFAYDLAGPDDNDVLAGMRLVFGSAMAGRSSSVPPPCCAATSTRHRAWMVRGYAIGLGAGTQVFTHAPYLVATGEQPDGNVRPALVVAGWVINLAVAEWYLRRPARVVTAPALKR